MKAPAFAYARPNSLSAVFDLQDQYGAGATLLAGGQSLLPSLNMRLSSPQILIDITAVPELSGVTVSNGVLRIGALTTHAQIAVSADIRRYLPLLSQAAPHIAHPAIRNAGTFGGSIAMADPAAEWPACTVALQAQLLLASRGGQRRVKASDFFRGLYDTAMQPGEVLLAAEFKLATAPQRSVFLELARRNGDYAIVGLAACTSLEAGRFVATRLVFLGAASKPFSAAGAAAALNGVNAGDTEQIALATRVAQQTLSAELQPDADLYNSAATKLHLARVLTGRAIAALAASPRNAS